MVYEEISGIRPRLILASMLIRLIPRYTGSRIRVNLLRAAGVNIGHGTTIMGSVHIHGSNKIGQHLQIGEYVRLNTDCFLDITAPIMIGNYVGLGHEVLLMTSSHKIGESGCRAGELISEPISIKEGAWLGSRCTIMPGVTVGAGSIVGSGAVVTKDVPPNTLVGGIPAKVIRKIEDE